VQPKTPTLPSDQQENWKTNNCSQCRHPKVIASWISAILKFNIVIVIITAIIYLWIWKLLAHARMVFGAKRNAKEDV